MFKYVKSGLLSLLAIGALQAQTQTAENWHHLPPNSKNFGINTTDAYAKLLKGKTSQTVVVAIIDGGTDIHHPDLKNNIWRNEDEIPFNGIDDDKNGYVDDSVGWNFLGNANGENVEFDNYEFVRIVRAYNSRFEDVELEDVDESELELFNKYKQAKEELDKRKESAKANKESSEKIISTVERLEKKLDKKPFEADDLKDVKDMGSEEANRLVFLIRFYFLFTDSKNSDELKKDFTESVKHYEEALEYHLNIDYDARKIIGDDYADINQRNYGNPNVIGPDAEHGTHVAGIVGAVRNNGYGMDGVADNVKLMILRVVPNGDERDKDVANAIRYAVDNGAKVINMSFGKGYSWNKKAVDEAVKYAASKNVLLVHAAGNDDQDNDVNDNFPNDRFEDESEAPNNWIEVGASNLNKKSLAASFSNYGKSTVDVFAPGVDIYSTTPKDSFQRMPGTSMASPVCAGLAALIWSYYPELTAPEVKEIIMASVKKYNGSVPYPGKTTKTSFKNLSVSGGVINAYNAIKMAEAKSKKK